MPKTVMRFLLVLFNYLLVHCGKIIQNYENKQNFKKSYIVTSIIIVNPALIFEHIYKKNVGII